MAKKAVSKVMMLDEEALKLVATYHARKYEDYLTQREDGINEAYARANWMYSGGSGRARYDSEKTKFVERAPDTKANVGSPMYHGQVNSMAGMLTAVLNSGHPLFKYTDKSTKGNPDSTTEMPALGMNALAARFWEIDHFADKMPEFATSIFKNSNIFALISMRAQTGTVIRGDLVPKDTGEKTEDGEAIWTYTKKMRKTRGTKFLYPTLSFPRPQDVYVDMHIPTIVDQDCVFILSQTTLQALRQEGKYLDQELITTIDKDKAAWDGTNGAEGRETAAEDRDQAFSAAGTSAMLRCDCYSWLPIDKSGKYNDEDPEVERQLYWMTYIGNTLADAVCIKAVLDFDPDGEIPLKEIHAIPDNSHSMYHSFLSDIVRSYYATDCTLINQALDRDSVINDPPLEVLEGAHRIKDFTKRKGQIWKVFRPNAIKEHTIAASQMQTVQLRQDIREDMKLALATDSTRLGEVSGGRTSATEIMKLTGATNSTLQLRTQYILGQLLPWLAYKYLSMTEAFVDPGDIKLIVGENVPGIVENAKVSAGLFDVSVDIVGNYVDDQTRLASFDRVIQLIANPMFLKSETHTLSMGGLLREYFETHKIDPKHIQTASGADSEANARRRIMDMLQNGTYQAPVEGEDTETHLRIARAEYAKDIQIPQDDPRSKNVPLILEYINALKAMADNAGTGGAAPAPGTQAQVTPGQEAGNELAAAMGGQSAGGVGEGGRAPQEMAI